MYRFGKTSLEEIATIWPGGQKILHHAMSLQIMDFGLVRGGGGRTQEYQDELYAQGRTKPGEIVTWTRNSNHLIDPAYGYGFAFDAIPFMNGTYSWNYQHCMKLATVILKAAVDVGEPIEWLYHKIGKDMPHFQKPR